MEDLEKRVNGYAMQGLIKAKSRDFAGAVAEFSQAIELAPDFAPLYYNRARVYEDQGNVAAALADYDRAIARNPQYDQAYNNRAGLRLRRGDVAGAIADWTAILQRKPDFYEAYYNRGLAYSSLRTREGVLKCITDMTQALRYAPPNFHYQIYQDRGVAYSLLGAEFGEREAFAQAEADLREAINEGSLFAYFARAKLYDAMDKPVQAIADLKVFLARGGGQHYGNLFQVQAMLRRLER